MEFRQVFLRVKRERDAVSADVIGIPCADIVQAPVTRHRSEDHAVFFSRVRRDAAAASLVTGTDAPQRLRCQRVVSCKDGTLVLEAEHGEVGGKRGRDAGVWDLYEAQATTSDALGRAAEPSDVSSAGRDEEAARRHRAFVERFGTPRDMLLCDMSALELPDGVDYSATRDTVGLAQLLDEDGCIQDDPTDATFYRRELRRFRAAHAAPVAAVPYAGDDDDSNDEFAPGKDYPTTDDDDDDCGYGYDDDRSYHARIPEHTAYAPDPDDAAGGVYVDDAGDAYW